MLIDVLYAKVSVFSPLHQLLVSWDFSGVQQLIHWRILKDKTQGNELFHCYSIFQLFLISFSPFPGLVHLLALHAHSHHNEVIAREVKRLIAVLTRPTLCSDVVQESMKVCAITERTASTLSVTCTSKTNWGFFKMLTQKRKGKLRAEDKTKVHLNIKVAHFLPDEFPWPFQSFAITE